MQLFWKNVKFASRLTEISGVFPAFHIILDVGHVWSSAMSTIPFTGYNNGRDNFIMIFPFVTLATFSTWVIMGSRALIIRKGVRGTGPVISLLLFTPLVFLYTK